MADKKPSRLNDDSELAIAEPVSTPSIATAPAVANEDSETLAIRTGDGGGKLRSSGGKLAGEAADKARGLVAQGLERASAALTNAARMVGDTADGIDERMGKEYGEYARRASNALDKAGRSVADKSPDELIDDTRTFVRNSPGMALAGAAVVGFLLARLVKTGLDSGKQS